MTLVNGEPRLGSSFIWGYEDARWEDMVRGRTAADGWADFPALSCGDATVLVQAPRYARRRCAWRNGQKELTVEMVREAVLAGDVRAAGLPVKACHINLRSGGDQIVATLGPDDEGRFRVAELPAGTWAVTVHGNGLAAPRREQVNLAVGETKTLQIQVEHE